jgi:predicted Zn-dependent protease
MKAFFYFFLFNFMLLTTFSQAQLKRSTYIYQAGQVQFWYPESWQIDEVEKVATLQNSEGELSISFSILPAEGIEEALNDLESIVLTQLNDPKTTSEPEIIEMNGMQGVVTELEGTMKGIAVQLGVFIIDGPENVLLVLGMGHKRSLSTYKKELNKIIKSIKPIN